MKPDDPKDFEKKEEENKEKESLIDKILGDEVDVYNADGTPVDTSDRTYISVDLPEENDQNKKEE